MRSFCPGYAAKLTVLGFLLALPACSRQPPPAPKVEKQGIELTGTVTYDGQPVAYGYVLFFPTDAMPDKTGRLKAVAVAPIVEGRYDTVLPGGILKLCVVTDPDHDHGTLAHAYMWQGSAPREKGKPKGLHQQKPP